MKEAHDSFSFQTVFIVEELTRFFLCTFAFISTYNSAGDGGRQNTNKEPDSQIDERAFRNQVKVK